MVAARIDVTFCGRRLVATDRPLVMGILNVTPDSFSDGGLHDSVDRAVAQARRMVDAGADILDIGGESTRPGAQPVDVAEEARRVYPVLEALQEAAFDVAVSVDTRHAATAAGALARGAQIVNDVSALSDPAMPEVVARSGAGVVLMHMQGTPGTMQVAPEYGDVVAEVRDWLDVRAQAAEAAGVSRERIIVDPGLGFGKRTGAGVEDNCALLAGLPALVAQGRPVLVGASRKRFIGNLTGAPVQARLGGSVAAALAAARSGAAIVRVHDVAETVQALRVWAAIETERL